MFELFIFNTGITALVFHGNPESVRDRRNHFIGIIYSAIELCVINKAYISPEWPLLLNFGF